MILFLVLCGATALTGVCLSVSGILQEIVAGKKLRASKSSPKREHFDRTRRIIRYV